MHEQFLARILRYGVYAIAFVPLIIFSQYISPFHFGKVVVFRSIVEIMAVLYLILLWRDRSYLPKSSPILWSLVGFALAFSFSAVLGVQKYFSFWGTLERMGGVWTFWHYLVFFVIATTVLRTRQHWFALLDLTLGVSILSALYGFGQKTEVDFFIGSGGRERIFGTIGNAALFAGYEIVNVFLALTLFFRPGNSSGQRWFYGVAAVIDGLAVIMTVVRGSLLGLGTGLFVFAVLYYLRYRSLLAKRVVLAMVLAAGIFFLVLITPVKDASFIKSSPFWSRLTDTSFESYTAKTRFWAWRAGLQGWNDNIKTILVGWGPESFNIPFSQHFDPRFFRGPGSETFFDRAHNMFMEVLVTMGLVGLGAYLWIFQSAWSSLRRFARLKPEEYIYQIGLISLLLAYAIHNSFIFDTSANLIVFFTVLGFIAFLLQSAVLLDKKPPAIAIRRSALQVPAALVMLALVSVVIYRTNIVPAKANYATTRAIVRSWAGDFPGAVAKFKESLSYDVPGKYEYRHRLAQYVLEYASTRRIDVSLQEALSYSIGEVKKNADADSLDYLPLLYLSRLHITLGKDNPASPDNDAALAYSLKALDLAPQFVRTYYEIGQAYLNKKDRDKAVEYFRRAAELNPEVGISFWYWGVIELDRGNVKEGLALVEEAFEKGYSGTVNDYLRVANAYAKDNNILAVVRIYERIVTVDSKNPQHYASLAAAYARVGRIDDAVSATRKAVALDSSFFLEAQAFVRSLGREL